MRVRLNERAFHSNLGKDSNMRLLTPAACVAVLLAAIENPAFAEPAISNSSAQSVLKQAEDSGRFTFIVFHREDSAATRQMLQAVKTGVSARSDRAVFAAVQVKDPTEAAVVKRFDVARAPMPMMIAVAPNGAVTGVAPKHIHDSTFDDAIVSATTAVCMKAIQENKLVIIGLRSSVSEVFPAFATELMADPSFKSRMQLTSVDVRDPKEAELLKQLQIDGSQIQSATAVVLAPPGVLVGKFDGSATKDQVAGAIHKAGKCCNDPHCKHNHGSSHQATQPNTTRRK